VSPARVPLILKEAQTMAQVVELTDFFWTMEDLPSNDTLPAMGLCLQNPNLLGQDTSHFRKLSWRAQANQKALHV
jgi:hypothetical protein